MAEALVFGLTQELLLKLGSPVIRSIELWYGIKKEFSKLRNTISVIQSVLLDAEEKHVQSIQIREWLGKLKDAVYDADDLLDDFSTKSLQRKALSGGKITVKVRIFFSTSNRLVYGYKMAQKIKYMQERLDEIANERKFHLEVRLEEKPFVSIGRDQTHSYVRDEDVIGRDEDKKNIRKLLLDVSVKHNVLIIPIIGIGGLGKTTLAKYLYNDASVQSWFEVKMWVCVSEPFDVKAIVENMIKSATHSRELGNLEMDELQLRFRGIIDGKKYLLVLDDVWNEDRNAWLNLEELLQGGGNGSRIIVTARSKHVAKATSSLEPYELNGLSEEEAWNLFKRFAFSEKKDFNLQMVVNVGKRIVKKCGGVPLAIKITGSLLFSRDPKTEWLSFESKDFSKIDQKENDILPTLKLSYDHLPSYLKNCFAYCKLFPKDTRIDVKDLICLWMAQGYIASSDIESSLSDIGFQYFKDLLWRSFFQEVEIDNLGNIESCKMHDLMHDLATIVGGTETVLTTPTQIFTIEKTRNLSLQSSSEISLSLVSSKTRTLLTFKCSGFTNSFFSSLPCIRTLKLRGARLKIIPNSIGELCHMRYLDLSDNDFKTLPNSITKLVNLQTLHLEYCVEFEAFPVNFKALKRLVCLSVGGCKKLKELPLGLGDLTSLESLKEFEIREDSKIGLKELYGLNQLRGNLSISGLEYSRKNDAGAGCLKEKKHLQFLQLSWSRTEIGRDGIGLEGLQPHLNLKKLSVDNYGGVMFASWLSSLTKLSVLKLKGCCNLKYLPPLDGLTMLSTLMIVGARELEYVEEEKCIKGMNGSKPISVFPSLESLNLSYCPNLKGWWENEESHSHYYFPTLSFLEITDCPKLTAMPSFPCVKGRLELTDTSGKPLVQTMKMKMSHVPSSSSSRQIPQTFPLSKVTSLSLSKIEDLAYLSLESLHSLEELSIDECINLNLSAEMEWKSLSNLTICNQKMISLQELVIVNCQGLISLANGMCALTSLQRLSIQECFNLISLPDYISALTSLEKLEIGNCSNLISLCEMRALTSLRSLYIDRCPELISLPDDISTLPCLQELRIEWCEKLHLVSGMFQHLTSLEKLTISNLPQLISLPDDISTLTSLRELLIWDCSSLISLCEMRSLTSLRFLYIRRCPELISLPDDISTLTSLQQLGIRNCPYLLMRYQKEIGEERHKIAHIPKITLL